MGQLSSEGCLCSVNETASTCLPGAWETYTCVQVHYANHKPYILVPVTSSPWTSVLFWAPEGRKWDCTSPALTTSESWETACKSLLNICWLTHILSIFWVCLNETLHEFPEAKSKKNYVFLIFKPYRLDFMSMWNCIYDP